MQDPLIFGCHYDVPSDLVELYGSKQSGPENISVVQPIVLKTVEQEMYFQPFMRVKQDEAQSLMDALWRAGVRPRNGEGSVGQIGALKDHLADMRQLVSNAYEVDLSGKGGD